MSSENIVVIEDLFCNVSKLYLNALHTAYLINGDDSRSFNWFSGR
jgi:hypothetical protein